MNITDIRIRLVGGKAERLRAFCSITFDGEFVVRDLKIIDGPNGPFVAMPSRKLTDRCRNCGSKNALRARFCYECGVRLREAHIPRDEAGRPRMHVDVAHPINAACRERLQTAIVEAYRTELEQAAQPGYRPTALDHQDEYDHEDAYDGAYYDELVVELRGNAQSRRAGERAVADGDARSDDHAPISAGNAIGPEESEPVKVSVSPSGVGTMPGADPLTERRRPDEAGFSQGIL